MDPQQAQVLLVNTCAFIEPAKKESIDAILAAAEVKNERRRQAAGGGGMPFAALRERATRAVSRGRYFRRHRQLSRPSRTSAPQRAAGAAADSLCGRGPSAARRPTAPRIKTGDPFSAYLKVSEGCDHRCAFCIIPKIRGRHESRPLDDLVEEARQPRGERSARDQPDRAGPHRLWPRSEAARVAGGAAASPRAPSTASSGFVCFTAILISSPTNCSRPSRVSIKWLSI